MPRNARLAVLCSFLFHGALILAGRYRFSYDAYNHMFFGDHYRMDWWSLWDARWYTGFFVTSYPPLVHQLIGALSHVVGIDAAFALTLWVTVALLPLAVYAFARIFIGRASAGYAALGAAFLPSVYLTAHIFGQLPTLFATVCALFSAASLANYLKQGGVHNLALTVALTATTMAAHHATLMLQPFLVIAVVLRIWSSHRAAELQRPRKISVPPWLIPRLTLFAIFAIAFSLIVIWPFWEWGRMQSIQTPIDHASRHNFFKDPLAPLMFFLPMYGPLMVIIPPALYLAYQRKLYGLGFGFFVLFLLGLGDTTPLPRLFFGEGWAWLTYDRFAFWASLLLLPFFGIIMILFRRGRARNIRIKIFGTLAAASLLVGFATVVLPLQPGAVDMRQVVAFLGQDDHADWRYLTFGFGDQLALLSTLTTATTIDGSYHTARTLPELRASGLGQIDTAYWLTDGLSKLDPVLQKAGERGVRWGFVNVSKYIPVLERNGWVKIKTLKGGVQVWENPKAELPPVSEAPPTSTLASFCWGLLPILSLVISLSLGSLRVWHRQAERVLQNVYFLVVGLTPISFCFWYYRTLSAFPHDRVYFTYTDALFFLTDGLILLAVILWFSTKLIHPLQFQLSTFTFLLLALCLFASLSVLWSRDWRISLYVIFHILLVFLFVLSLRDWSHAWKFILLGFCAALAVQCMTGIVEFLSQSTAFLTPLYLKWPGVLDPSVHGAVIVELPNGESFLRAYGTLPHPNILGGFTFVFLLAPIAFFLRNEKPNHLALLLLMPGVALFALTFSRAAWLALFTFCVVLMLKSRLLERKRLLILITVVAVSFLLTLVPYRQLVEARTTNNTSHAEEFSLIGRAWLNGEATTMIREYPLTGVGIGSFIVELSRRAGEGYVIEPAHNVFLLAGAELGLPGVLLLAALSIWFAYRLFKTENRNAIFSGATLTGLGVVSLFDHYLWTLAPGRLLLGLVIGLFLGQDIDHEL